MGWGGVGRQGHAGALGSPAASELWGYAHAKRGAGTRSCKDARAVRSKCCVFC